MFPSRTKYGCTLRLIVSWTSGSAACTSSRTSRQIACCQSGSASMYWSTRGSWSDDAKPMAWRAGQQAYGVIVQADALLGLSTAIIAPTSRNAAPATFRPEVDVAGGVTRVLVEQLRAVDLSRLTEHVGRL